MHTTRSAYVFVTMIFAMLGFSSTYAANLCDDSCSFTGRFPEGGSLEATEPVTITFGEGGFIYDGASIVGYAAGDVIKLNAGQSLHFSAGGEFALGVNGNIDYSYIKLVNGLHTVTGTAQINIYRLTVTNETISLPDSSTQHESPTIIAGESLTFVTASNNIAGIFDPTTPQGSLALNAQHIYIEGQLSVAGALSIAYTDISFTDVPPSTSYCTSTAGGGVVLSAGNSLDNYSRPCVSTITVNDLGPVTIDLTQDTITNNCALENNSCLLLTSDTIEIETVDNNTHVSTKKKSGAGALDVSLLAGLLLIAAIRLRYKQSAR